MLHGWDVTEGTVRYDDDPGNDPDSPWQVIVAEHADEVISGIYVTVGFPQARNPTGCLRDTCASTEVFLLAAKKGHTGQPRPSLPPSVSRAGRP